MLVIRDQKIENFSAESNQESLVDTEFITSWKWSTDEEHVHWPRVKQRPRTGIASRTNVQTSRPIAKTTSALRIIDSHGTKRSAPLYEITERTKQLAKPRCKNSNASQRNNESRASSKLSPRVLELSRPRIVIERPIKSLDGYVAPGALRAVATPRILELSEPKKQPVELQSISKTRKSYPKPCSPRILTLARPKRRYIAKGRTVMKNSRKRPRNFFSHNRPNMKKTSYNSLGHRRLVNVIDNSKATNNKSRKDYMRPSSSNRSVIVIETLCKPKKLKCGSRQ